MATKTITVTEDAYESIKSLKREHESFSHLLLRLARQRDITDTYFGILKGDAKDAQERIKAIRDGTSKDARRRHDALFGHIRDS